MNLNSAFILVFSVIVIVKRYLEAIEKNENHSKSNWIAETLSKCIPTIFVLLFIFITMLFSTGLLFYHLLLISKNVSTKEEIKKLVHSQIGNPNDKGCCKNWSEFYSRRKKNEITVVQELQKKVKIENNTTNISRKLTGKPLIKPYHKTDPPQIDINSEKQKKKDEESGNCANSDVSSSNQFSSRSNHRLLDEIEENNKNNGIISEIKSRRISKNNVDRSKTESDECSYNNRSTNKEKQLADIREEVNRLHTDISIPKENTFDYSSLSDS